MSEYKSGYECPECNEWEPPTIDQGFYYIEDGDAIDCTKWTSEGALAKPPKSKKAYPIYGQSKASAWAAMEFGGNPIRWDETHCCPTCEKEFTFENCNY